MVKMKNFLQLFIVTLSMLFVAACDVEDLEDDDDNVVLAESISLGSALTLEVGATAQLTASVMPADTTNKSVTYMSSDESIATVDSSGTVTAVAAGNVTVTATSSGTTTGTSVSGQVVITVNNPVVLVTGVDLGAAQTLELGDTAQLTATVTPDDASTKSLVYSSSNTAVATVDENGLVSTVTQGTAIITAENVQAGVSGTVDITVIVSVTDIDLGSAITIALDDTAQIVATITPADSTDMTLTYVSSDTTVATVDASGLVTPVAVGNATITATNTATGVSDTVDVTINPDFVSVSDIDLGNEFIINKEQTYQIMANVMPADATDSSLVYSSSDEAVATVDANGLVTPVQFGIATITAVNEASGVTRTVDMTVDAPIAGALVLAEKYDRADHDTADFVASSGITYTHVDGNHDAVGAAADIVGTDDDGLYRGERGASNGNPLNIAETVANGNYVVTLHFSETWHNGADDGTGGSGGAGARVLDVSVEGTQIEAGLDIFNEVGHAAAYDSVSPLIEVSDGELNIDITATAGDAKVGAILIQEAVSSIGDEDSDGVLNYLDECMDSAAGANVNDVGCVPPVFAEDFETGDLGKFSAYWNLPDGAVTEVSSEHANNGTYSIKVVTAAKSGNQGNGMVVNSTNMAGALVGGKTYKVSFYVKALNSADGSWTGGFFRLVNTSDGWVGSGQTWFGPQTDEWVLIEKEFTVDAGWVASGTGIDFLFNNAGWTFYFDDFQIHEVVQ